MPFRLGHHQVGKAFHRGQIKLAVFKRAASEFARLRGRRPSICDKRRKYRRDDRMATMQLKLGDIFAGFALRPRKPERQRLIDDLAVAPTDARKRALRGSGILPVSALSASPARGPEIRTTAMAAGGRPEDSA